MENKGKKMETPMSNSELYYMLVERGYKIDITKEKNSKVIRFNGKYATKESNKKIQIWYSSKWTDDEIKKRCSSKAINLAWIKIKNRT